jgi:predicted ATPase
MRLSLENIGIIETANVEINGLTLIAGNNDSGKSTIGKIAYALTKAFEDFEKNYKKEKAIKMNLYSRDFYILLRKNIELRKYPKLFQLMDDFRHYSRIDDKKLFETVENSMKILDDIDVNEEAKENITKSFNRINSIVQEKDSRKSKIIKSIRKIFKSEFSSQITNVFENEGRIEVYEGENKIINIIIKDDEITMEKTNIIDEIFPFDSSVFIETPFALTYKGELELSNIYHVDDLLYKLMKPDLKKDKTKLNISEIVGGEICFDEENDQFLFKKNVGNKKVQFQISNSASGIKSLGILQILENAGEFNRNLLLVIDEPEVHLHPDWQVEYAKILIKLVENGVKVLVTSHSPYLIEAINKYSKNSKIEQDVKFYLSELKNNGKALIVDKTNDKDEIFDKLSKPFERLIFGD